MATGNEYANITQKKLLGYRDLNDRLLEYLINALKEKFSYVWGNNIVLGSQLTLEADGADAFKITGDSVATDGIGNLLKISDSLVNDSISFENTTSVNYYVGLKYAKIPNEIDINPRTGNPEYRSWMEEIGEEGTPDSVTDNGNGTITFTVDSVTESGVTNAGRQVLVYKVVTDKNATTASIAIEICTVSWSGTNNTITTTASLGQSSVSLITNDYQVVLLGPSVKRYTDLRSESNYVFIGIIEGNGGTPTVFNMDDQNVAAITMNDFADLQAEMRLYEHMGSKAAAKIDDSTYDAIHRKSWFPSYNYGMGTTTELYYGSGACVTDFCGAIINGRLKNIVFGRLNKIRIYDDETGAFDDVQLDSYFPGTNSYWHCVSGCRDGDRLFVLGIGQTTFAMALHCFDINTWTPYTGWSAARSITTLSGLNVTGMQVINANDDYVAVSDPEEDIDAGIDSAVYIISKADSTILGSGAGDYTPNAGSGHVKWITSNGTYVFFVIEEATDAYVCSMSIASPGNTGCGVSGWPYQSFNANTYSDLIAFGDFVFVSMHDDTYLGYIFPTVANLTGFYINVNNTSSPYCTQLGRLTYDGNCIWALGRQHLGAYDRSKLYKIDIRQLTLKDGIGYTDGIPPLITPYEIEYKTSNHFQGSPDYAVKLRTPLYFNGKDIWAAGNDFTYGATNGKLQGYIYRLPRILNL